MTVLWERVREPRVQRVVYTFVYALLAGAGVAVLRQPPQSIEGQVGTVLAYTWGAFLVLAVAGAIGVLPGWWWLEKIGGISATVGISIYAVITVSLHFTEPIGNRLPQALVITVLALLLGIRAWEIRGLDYEPRG